jgi:hypothetical protein
MSSPEGGPPGTVTEVEAYCGLDSDVGVVEEANVLEVIQRSGQSVCHR